MSNTTYSTPYPPADPKPKFPAIEEEVLAYWASNDTFQHSIDARPVDSEFVFYDGPPFANGLPHYGHLVTGYVKDIVPRYQTMRGNRVERRFGWDCHGLPAEMQTEKELGISGRKNIIEYGIDKFNDHCREAVLRYTQDWEQYVTRQARWVDFENDYKTMDITFMESVLWAFKELWKKDLIYKDYRVVPYSWAVESPLSNFETRLDNSYRSRQDPAITVVFTLDAPTSGSTTAEGHLASGFIPEVLMGDKPTKILVWTTTPWTLPSNLALAVGAEIEYAVFEEADARYIVGAALVGKYEKQLANATQVGTVVGKELVGRTYKPIFDFFADTAGAFRVIAADFVSTEDGTGVVHIAPGFGEDDLVAGNANGIPIVCPVDSAGLFTKEVPPYEGMLVFDANKPIIKELKDRGVLVKHETYVHNYPHCWRTDEPLIYKAINSWYVKVTAIKDRMVELNQSINWVPSHIRDGQFGRWLENARDWNISRNRFWGVPLPVWVSDDSAYPRVDVYGSIAELEADFGVTLTDLHRPSLDPLTRPNPDDPTGQSTMRRVEEVLDCWFESGSMPFAQLHYPFENKERFEAHFPGDFIVEYIAQTRGWFYTLMVMGTALFDRAPFRNCMCHGVVLAEGGQKMSKRLQNYPDPLDVFNQFGSDALRWYMVSGQLLVGGDIEVAKDGAAIAQCQRLVVLPIWNAFYFFSLYANTDGVKAEVKTDSPAVLDRYILAKTRQLLESVTAKFDVYDIPGACTDITRFLDAMNNWFIRRSRDRFWKSERDADKQHAYNTLYTVLTTLCRIAAPLLPLITERIYRDLTGDKSVHLTAWPDANSLPYDPDLVEDMDRTRDICSAALAIRETKNLRVRLPLAGLTVAGPSPERLKPYLALIQDEVNVKSITLTDSVEQFGRLELKVNPKIGARIGGAMKSVMAAASAGDFLKLDGDRIEIAGQTLEPADYTMRLIATEGLAVQTLADRDGAVALDTNVTPELEREGLARDVVRLIQTTRKEADLNIADHIRLTIAASDVVKAAVEAHRAFVSEQTLADEIVFGDAAAGVFAVEHNVDGGKIVIGVQKVG